MRRLRPWKVVKIATSSLVAAALVSTGIIGFAHTKSGRPVLAWMGKHGIMPGAKGGCPLGYDKQATPEQKEIARRNFAVLHGAEGAAAARPALGFVLDQTTRADVNAWATKNGVTCAAGGKQADLVCSEVPVGALPAPVGAVGMHGIWFNFGPNDALVSVISFRRDKSVDAISSTLHAVEDEVTREAGPAAKIGGDGSPTELETGMLAQSFAEYRFKNYYAVARATNMGADYVLTEEYRALPN